MSTEVSNYEALLTDIESRIAKLQAAAEGIRMILAQSGGSMPSPDGGGTASISHSAFLGMSIPEAAKKHLATVKQKKSTQELIEALTAGGLPKAKYTTVYNILTRRQKQVGDIVNMKGDWGLAEWYPNYRVAKQVKESSEEPQEKKAASA